MHSLNMIMHLVVYVTTDKVYIQYIPTDGAYTHLTHVYVNTCMRNIVNINDLITMHLVVYDVILMDISQLSQKMAHINIDLVYGSITTTCIQFSGFVKKLFTLG
jgi:hypothetical protein